MSKLQEWEDVIHCTAPLRFGVTMFVAIVLSLVFWEFIKNPLERLFTDTRDPVLVYSAEILEDTAIPGGLVTVAVDRMKVRDCPLVVNAFWTDRQGTLVPGEHVRGGNTELGRVVIRVQRRVPETVSPGMEWGYSPLLDYRCEDGRHLIKQAPAWVTIVEPKDMGDMIR